MRRLRAALVIGLGLAALAAAMGPARVVAQAEASVAETAWWSRQPTNAPGTAFEVGRAPDDDISVVAFRIHVSGQPSRAELQLSEIQTAGTASMRVCPTASQWTAGGPKGWDERPEPSCPGTHVRLAHNEIQRLYTVDILSFLPPGQSSVALMVVPAPDESVTVPPPLPPPPVALPTPPVTAPPPSTIPAQPPAPLPFTVTFSGATLLVEGDAAPAPDPVTDPGFTPLLEPSGPGTSDEFFATPEVPAADEQALLAPSQVEGRFPQRGDVGLPPGEGAHQPWGRAPLLALVAAAVGAGTSFGRQRLRERGWLGIP